jgi:hypothetical protein
MKLHAFLTFLNNLKESLCRSQIERMGGMNQLAGNVETAIKILKGLHEKRKVDSSPCAAPTFSGGNYNRRKGFHSASSKAL